MRLSGLDSSEIARRYLSGETTTAIAKSYGVSVWAVITRLRKQGVEIRPHECHIGPSLTDQFTLLEILDGLLLGDGSLAKKGYIQMDQCLRREGWLLDVQEKLRLVGVSSKITPTKARTRTLRESGRVISSGVGGHLYSVAYMELKPQRQRWYPDGVKIVPPDIKLTPMTLAQWFCGDGSGGSDGSLVFHTEGFSEREVDFLLQRFHEDVGLNPTKGRHTRPNQFCIKMLKLSDVYIFRELVSPFIPVCCRYKLRHVRQGQFSKLLQEQAEDIRHRRSSGDSVETLAASFHKSPQAIRALLRGDSFKTLRADA